jgi:hypothetical protein
MTGVPVRLVSPGAAARARVRALAGLATIIISGKCVVKPENRFILAETAGTVAENMVNEKTVFR